LRAGKCRHLFAGYINFFSHFIILYDPLLPERSVLDFYHRIPFF
jgi:hypothetical protein